MQANCALSRSESLLSAAEQKTDERLMADLRDGDNDALAGIVRRYQADIFRFCLHYLRNVDAAKEMAQETFLRVYTARDRFDTSRKFKPWVLCIARNLCLNEVKRKRGVQMETLEEYASASREESGEVLQSAEDGPVEAMITQERHLALQEALDALPEEAREIVVLRYFERMSAREIAEIVGATEGAVRTRLHRTLRQMRDACGELRDNH